MNTIRNYLESMFAKLPNTPEVIKAKCELGQMMEDKYSELIHNGKSENEAVAQVISEFGNLEELADALGIREAIRDGGTGNSAEREVSLEEARSYLDSRAHCSLLHGLGTFFAVLSPGWIILSAAFGWSTRLDLTAGLLFLFTMIAACVGLHVYASLRMRKWAFLKTETCSIDYGTAGMVNDVRRASRDMAALQRTVAVLLFCTCYVPLSLFAVAGASSALLGFGVVLLLFMTGLGTLILIVSSSRENGCRLLLGLNSPQRVDGSYYKGQGEGKYTNKAASAILSVLWPTAVCIYLIVSFLTFSWAVSWIIFPITVVVDRLLKTVFRVKEGKENE